MDRNTKVVAGAVGALALAIAVGATGAIAVERALSGDEQHREAAIHDQAPQLFEGVRPRGKSGGRGRSGDTRPFGHPGTFGGLDAAAIYLDVSEEELHGRLRDGESLAEIAEDEGKSVAGLVDAMVAAAAERIDDAVEDGRLDEERAAEVKKWLEERITGLVEGKLRGPPFGRPGFGPWQRDSDGARA